MLERYIDMSLNLSLEDLQEVIEEYFQYEKVTLEDIEFIECLGFDINEFNSYLLN